MSDELVSSLCLYDPKAFVQQIRPFLAVIAGDDPQAIYLIEKMEASLGKELPPLVTEILGAAVMIMAIGLAKKTPAG